MLDNQKQFLSSLPNKPGVYQMFDVDHQILYVGKAKNLKNRVSSYFRATSHPKTKLFMSKVKSVEIIITPSENAALLLESNLIKEKKPRYNILFKDDKSFPYLLLSKHEFPRLSVHRGAVSKKLGKYFGPFPDAGAVNFILNLLQKIFKVRVCKDSFMRNRSRPCMLYQIKLCSGPCVGNINKSAYGLQMKLIEQFLSNKSNFVVKELAKLMDVASSKMAYEQAANYRDQIISIRKVQAEQAITKAGGDCDVIAFVIENGNVCINILFVRSGLVLGNKSYFPKVYNFNLSPEEILSAFMIHHYLQPGVSIVIPERILLNIKMSDRLVLAKIFQDRFKQKIKISDNVKGVQKELIIMSEANAQNALKTHRVSSVNYDEYLSEFKKALRLSKAPRIIECFDVSHTMGEATVASCVVFKDGAPSKEDYRKFNVKAARAGDDYGALREVLLRRYSDIEILPNLIMIDGGLGQLNVVVEVLIGLNIKNVVLMSVAKGEGRKPGLETVHLYGKKLPLHLSSRSKALHFIQQVRDEAHRFAIGGHRRKMRKSRQKSELENIPGIGKSKRAILLKYFGSLSELKSVGVSDLAKVSGIGQDLAKRIYDHLHA